MPDRPWVNLSDVMPADTSTELRPQSPLHFATERELPAKLRLMRWLGHQEWAPRGTDRMLRAFHHPDSGKHFRFEVDFFGKRYRGDLAHYIDWLVFSYGAAPHCELTLLRAATEYVRARREEPIHFIDVGANVGHHTLFMSGVADGVISFEPFPSSCAELREKLALNHVTNVRVIPVGLGEKDEELPYFASTGANSGIGTFLEHGTAAYEQANTLSVRNGDPLFEQLALPRMDILKVDVEGFEPQVLRGLQQRIRRDRPVVLTELMDSTRASFGSEDGLRACFYENASFYGVEGPFNKRSYRLTPFRFAETDEILVLPPEYAEFATLPQGCRRA